MQIDHTAGAYLRCVGRNDICLDGNRRLVRYTDRYRPLVAAIASMSPCEITGERLGDTEVGAGRMRKRRRSRPVKG